MLQNLLPNTPTVTLLTSKSENLDHITAVAHQYIQKPIEMNQVHSARVEVVDHFAPSEIPQTDALITKDNRVMLIIRMADCLPVLMYHPSGVVAAIHAGRRGTQAGIVSKTLEILHSDFGITDTLSVWFGPHICASCYEIDPQTHLHFDLTQENTDQLQASGIQFTLFQDKRCTLHQDDFHSYRRSGKGVLMNFAAIGLLPVQTRS